MPRMTWGSLVGLLTVGFVGVSACATGQKKPSSDGRDSTAVAELGPVFDGGTPVLKLPERLRRDAGPGLLECRPGYSSGPIGPHMVFDGGMVPCRPRLPDEIVDPNDGDSAT